MIAQFSLMQRKIQSMCDWKVYVKYQRKYGKFQSLVSNTSATPFHMFATLDCSAFYIANNVRVLAILNQ